MKNAPRFHARRVLQGGAAFAALGALSLATAMPAHADTYGWAYASAVSPSGTSETYITQSQTVTNTFDNSIGSWLTVQGTTSAVVDANGASATTVVESARLLITVDDLEEILDLDEDEDEDDDEEDDEGDDLEDEDDDLDEEDDDLDDEEEENGNEEEEENNDADNGASEPPVEPSPSPAPTTGPVEPSPAPQPAPSPQPTISPSAPELDEEAEAETSSVIDLDEENSVLVDGGGEVVIEATITGASVTTTQTWDGTVTHSANEGTVTLPPEVATMAEEEVLVEVLPAVDQGVVQTEDAGFLWNDAYTNLYLTFAVNGEVVNGYAIAESAAGITTGQVGGGEGGSGGGGDHKTPPKERDKDTLPTPDAKKAEPLAQTGTPVLGLIAAGAAIAAGGGAAAYLARRRKNDEAAESEESTEN